MRALEVRAKFGEVVDQAAAGERIVVERAGQPIAAIVPLSDLAALDPEAIRERRKAAFDQLMRTVRRTRHLGVPIPADFVRADRDRGHTT
jgi:prevent-host-death family protein